MVHPEPARGPDRGGVKVVRWPQGVTHRQPHVPIGGDTPSPPDVRVGGIRSGEWTRRWSHLPIGSVPTRLAVG